MRRGEESVTVDLGVPVDGGSGIVVVPIASVRDDDVPVPGAASSAPLPRVWKVGDRVKRVEGPEILLGSVGTVVAVDIPGRWPIRVQVDARIGFGEVLCSADELAPEDEAGP
ncbi:hypothetical protein [Myceligenerans halotolerans]